MTIELKIPEVGESIQEVQIGRWLKQPGDAVKQDEDLVELETDKASMELPAPVAGVLVEILKQQGDIVAVGEVIARLQATDGKAIADATAKAETSSGAGAGPVETPATDPREEREAEPENDNRQPVPVTPSARRALREHGLTAEQVAAGGRQLRREDVERHVSRQGAVDRQGPAVAGRDDASSVAAPREPAKTPPEALEEAVPMSLIRKRIAQRLVEAQRNAALLTTFNEIDMTAVIDLRQKYREAFQEQYGVKLGFMSFFVKAVIDSLKQCPELNAEIRDEKIVYRRYYHVGVAIGGGRGLVVPVVRYAERLSFAEIETAIGDFAARAASNDLEPEELEGGTFTITNGGVYGSLLSTPIVNPPQSGVLGMHAIEQRPVAVDGQVVIRPMMYVALGYDHRIVDGRDAVTFLKRVKQAIEDPSRMLIEV